MSSLVLRLTAVLLTVLFILAPADPVAAAQPKSFVDIELAPVRDRESEARGELRADAKEAARILNIEPYVERLRTLKKQGMQASGQLSRRDQTMRLLCLWKLLVASEEVEKLTAKIYCDLDASQVTLQSLTARKNLTADLLNTLNFAQSGVQQTVHQGVVFNHGLPALGTELAISSSGWSVALSPLYMIVPPLWSHRIGGEPTALTYFFDKNYGVADSHRGYIWKFMNSKIPGSSLNLTRREMVLKHWEDFAAVNSADKQMLDRLAANTSESINLRSTISILSKRVFLLEDLKVHFEEFDGSLYELHKAIAFD